MQLITPAFQNNQNIPVKYTCAGENINPALIFSEVPKNTQSLVLICHDPDALGDGGWTHWVVINMTPSTPGTAENAKSDSGLELTTNFGTTDYGGPCPPSGTHRYIFYFYALDATLGLDASAKKEEMEAAMEGHLIEKVGWMGVYERASA